MSGDSNWTIKLHGPSSGSSNATSRGSRGSEVRLLHAANCFHLYQLIVFILFFNNPTQLCITTYNDYIVIEVIVQHLLGQLSFGSFILSKVLINDIMGTIQCNALYHVEVLCCQFDSVPLKTW